ncbi:MAG: 6-pyruvoyl-tetrahydropterin synthase-related protein, partial [Terracidiphilus sp.]
EQGNKRTGTGNSDQLRYFGGALMVFLAAFVAIVPQLLRGNSCGHDFDVHFVSWLDCVNAWRHGIVYPHWAPSPNYGAGEPRFVFYPPLTWMLGGALGVAMSWNLAPIALTFLTLAATGLATRALALEALDDLPATLAGCTAIFSGYALFTGYERGAFPEFAGGFWLPLIVLFAMREGSAADSSSLPRPQTRGTWGTHSLSREAFGSSTALLAIALAGAWLSNLPLGVMAGYLMAGVALVWAVVRKSVVPLVRAGVAAVLGLGLAAIYWLPAAFERNWVDIKQATQDPGYNFESNWLFAHNANPVLALHDQILQQVSWIAVSMIAVAAVCFAICWVRGTLSFGRSGAHRLWWVPLAAVPAVVLFFLFPVSRPLWHLLPEMAFLQYPWRWLEAVEAPMAIFFVAAVWPSGRRARVAVLVICCAAFLGVTIYASRYFFQVCYPEDTVATVVSDYRAGTGFEGMYEYEPPGGDDSNIAIGLPDACLVEDPSVALGKPDSDDPDSNPTWSRDQGSCDGPFHFVHGLQANPEHREIFAAAPHAGYLVLRLLSYPAWRVRVNGHELTGLPRRDDGLIAVPVSQGQFHLTVDWTISPDVLAGRWVSGLSVLLVTILWFRRSRTRLT